MRLRYTAPAQADVEAILQASARDYPGSTADLIAHIRRIQQRIAQWPRIAPVVQGQRDIHVIPLVRYPFRIYYRVASDAIEVLHVRHSSRQDEDLWTE